MGRRIVVTGAFSNIGAAVAENLLERGDTVHTLTGRDVPSGSPITRADLRFDREHLVWQLRGADALVNTYWIRLPMAGQTFEGAVENAQVLFTAAREAEVGRVVHVSVSNAPNGTNLGYYRGKAKMERLLAETGLPHTILRPTLVLSERDILTSNIVWLLRQLPVFLLPKNGAAQLQPILLHEAGQLIADAIDEKENRIGDLAGPEIYTFREYIELLCEACALRRLLLPVPNGLALFATRVMGWLLSDVILSREELLGLQQELLLSHEAPAGQASVRAWLMEHGPKLGRRYLNDRRRHFGDRRTLALS